MRRGIHAVKSFPSGIGLESAGVIDAVGLRGRRRLGRRPRVACAGMPEGSYAELRIVPAARLIPLPAGIDERTAASMMIRGMTARSLLEYLQGAARRHHRDPRRRRRRRPDHVPVGEAPRRHRDRHGERREGGGGARARLRSRHRLHAQISPNRCARSRTAKACRWSTIPWARRRSRARCAACAGAA